MGFTDLCVADGFGAVGASEARPVGRARLKSSYPICVQMFRSLFRIGPATNGFGMAVCARVTLDYNAMPSVSGSDWGQTPSSAAVGHRSQELRVALGLAHLREQEFHCLCGRERRQNLPQNPDAIQIVPGDEHFLFAGP